MKNVLLVTHATEVFGPPGALREYLKSRTINLIYLAYPLDKSVKLPATASVYKNGQLICQRKLPGIFYRMPVPYLGDFLGTIYFGLALGRRNHFDYYIGANNLNCLAGLILKMLIKIDRVVFYAVDYSPVRFKQGALDWLYRQIDRLALQGADFVWSNNRRVAALRRRQGLPARKSLLVPNGVTLKSIPQVKRQKNPAIVKLVFQGHLTKVKGAWEVIEALARVNQRHHCWQLTIIGSGPFESDLRRLAARKHLTQKINFLGHLPNQTVLEKMVKYDVGIALYNEAESYTRYCDPVKVKEYLAGGLAVLMTDVPYVAQLIRRQNLGLVIKPGDAAALRQAFAKLLTCPKNLAVWQRNARETAPAFDWTVIFDQAFIKMKPKHKL